ncbi:Inositol 2-dehydrogenase [Rubripirellula tenax]|uniref:Inositol 2-dehydrogenase n=1 Tax=Rubripirellula tenax TaxID=2528015 RepID=A0A5C6ESE3_9BACT|nr:Gfo/Idh/MocA family oxidoreductase [Rubripirellula tenax]TWU50506.1 Inositol 2-dehydrogenase [Rubripirellula tenax]
MTDSVHSPATRRNFLKTASIATVAATPYFWTSASAKAESANDKLHIGSIGTSIYSNRYTGDGDHPGRGAVIGHQAGVLGDMVAVADVNSKAAAFFADRYKGNCQMYKDYEDLIARDDIDAVTIGTPDHWHAKIAIDAMRAGKHVYCEKPLSLTIREGQQVCQVAKETGKIFQVGTQQRSEFDQVFLHAVAIAQSGMLGETLDCLISVGNGEKGGPYKAAPVPEHLDWDKWLGQTPKVPYCPERCDFDFRWWLEYSGGQVTDWGVHHGDIAMWAMGMSDSGPTSIQGKGTYPKIENGFNVAVDFDCQFEFEGGHTARLYSGKNELIISGDKGRIRVNRGGLSGKPAEELGVAHKIGVDEWGSGEAADGSPIGGRGPDWLQEAVDKLCHGKKPGNHMANFFECIREGGTPISDVNSHHRSVSLCHLANIAMRLDRKVKWDPSKEVFIGDDEANSMIAREQREGYQIEV